MSSTPPTHAEDLWCALVELGVTVLFANPGTTELPLVRALDGGSGVRPVLCLHESVATGAADGYGRVRRTPAATLLHLGPGLANGISNLHNARKAGSPIVNLVGEMPTWHRGASGSALAFDVESLARTVSADVRVLSEAARLAVPTVPCLGGNNIVTYLIPSDVQLAPGGFERAERSDDPASSADLPTMADELRRHRSAVYLGGISGSARLLNAVADLGLPALVANSFGSIDRGQGLPAFPRMPYWPEDQITQFAQFDCVLFVGTPVPQSLFGSNGESNLLRAGTKVHELKGSESTICAALEELASMLAPARRNTGPAVRRCPVPQGKLSAETLCQAIAAVQPEDAIVIDESITSGTSYWRLSRGCPRFTHLGLSGGSIGFGPAAAVGAAIAAPARRVIDIEGDGSALYAPQALWTQARERLNVVTVVCANRSYNILEVELARGAGGGPASPGSTLLRLADPEIDWMRLAAGFGVRAVRTDDAGELARLLREALETSGPTLIEAVVDS